MKVLHQDPTPNPDAMKFVLEQQILSTGSRSWRAGETPDLPLAESSDGVVPYASAHLDGALSEKVIPSWHSVQESPQAILEIRRILRLPD